MWKAGRLPVPAEQLPTGAADSFRGRTLCPSFFFESKERMWKPNWFVYAQSQSLPVVEAVSEIGSGLNGQRPNWKDSSPARMQTIVVEHRDRLMRFGAEYVEAALAARGRKLMVVESSEVRDDLVQDRLEVLTSFCARLYGRRSAQAGAKSLACHGAIIETERQSPAEY